MMVGAMKNDWGKKLYEGTLTRNIAGVIYKVKSIALGQKMGRENAEYCTCTFTLLL